MELNNLEQLNEYGDILHRSSMFGTESVAQGVVMAEIIHSRKLDILEFLNTYNKIGTNISMKADAMLAKFIERGGKHTIIQRDDESASIKLDTEHNSQIFKFTWKEAAKEGFVHVKDKKTGARSIKHGWDTPRGRMQRLWARVVSDGVRVMDPCVNFGMYTPEEVSEFPENNDAKLTEDRPAAFKDVKALKEKLEQVPKPSEKPAVMEEKEGKIDRVIADKAADKLESAGPGTVKPSGPETPAPVKSSTASTPSPDEIPVENDPIPFPAIFPNIHQANGELHKLSGQPVPKATVRQLEFFVKKGESIKWMTPELLKVIEKELSDKGQIDE